MVKCLLQATNRLCEELSKHSTEEAKQAQHRGSKASAVLSELTNSCCCDRVWVILVDLEGPEDVCCGMQGARPDDAQAGEMEGQQAQLADQAMLLQDTPSPLSLLDSCIAQQAGGQHTNSEASTVRLTVVVQL